MIKGLYFLSALIGSIGWIYLTKISTVEQDETYHTLPVPQEYLKAGEAKMEQISELYEDAYDVAANLSVDPVRDGSKDYTAFIQDAMDNNQVILFPDFPLLINETGLTVNSESVLIFQPGSKLVMKPNSLERYEVLRIHNVQNVSVYYPVIEGEREHHKGETGQWGMGIAIRSSKNVRIIGPAVSNCWGDGIYIGRINNEPSEDIVIKDAILDRNRRNGISVTNVDGLKIIRPVISNTFGNPPQSGIDIEPNTKRDVINNILIESPITFNSFKYGIIISLNRMAGPEKKEVNITINNHLDDHSSGGLAINRVYGDFEKLPFEGKVAINNPVWKNGRVNPFYYIKQRHGYKLEIHNYSIYSKREDGKEYLDNKKMERVNAQLTSGKYWHGTKLP